MKSTSSCGLSVPSLQFVCECRSIFNLLSLFFLLSRFFFSLFSSLRRSTISEIAVRSLSPIETSTNDGLHTASQCAPFKKPRAIATALMA